MCVCVYVCVRVCTYAYVSVCMQVCVMLRALNICNYLYTHNQTTVHIYTHDPYGIRTEFILYVFYMNA